MLVIFRSLPHVQNKPRILKKLILIKSVCNFWRTMIAKRFWLSFLYFIICKFWKFLICRLIIYEATTYKNSNFLVYLSFFYNFLIDLLRQHCQKFQLNFFINLGNNNISSFSEHDCSIFGFFTALFRQQSQKTQIFNIFMAYFFFRLHSLDIFKFDFKFKKS